jgi:hypothetical protein
MEAYRLNRLPRDCAMRERTHWFFVIAILSFLGTSVVAPALARGGVNTGMVGFRSGFAMHTARPSMRSRVVMRHIFARHADVQNDLRFRRRTPLQNGLPITNWPYSPYTDTAPMDVRSDPERSSPFTTRHCNVWLVQRWARPHGTRNTAGFQLCCRMPRDSQWLPL